MQNPWDHTINKLSDFMKPGPRGPVCITFCNAFLFFITGRDSKPISSSDLSSKDCLKILMLSGCSLFQLQAAVINFKYFKA